MMMKHEASASAFGFGFESKFTLELELPVVLGPASLLADDEAGVLE
jgi:hypothetical protein